MILVHFGVFFNIKSIPVKLDFPNLLDHKQYEMLLKTACIQDSPLEISIPEM